MAKKISSLSVVLGGTVAPFVSMFKGAGSAVTGFVGKLGGAGSSILKFTGIAGGLSAILGGIGFGALIKGQLDAIDVNAKLTDRLGVSSEALAGLQHAGNLAGVSAEGLTTGLEFMLKNVAKAAGGNKVLAASFAGVGLDAQKLISAKPEDAFAQIADAMKGIDNPAKRALAATQIFGKAGQSLLPLLMSGADGIHAAMKEAEALGLTFSRVDAAKVEEANDAFTRMQSTVTGVFRSITIAIAPFLTSFANTFTQLGIKVVSVVKAWLPTIMSILGSLWQGITAIFTSIYSTVAPIVTGIIGFIQANWQTMVAGAVTRFMAMWNVVSSVFGAVWQLVTSIGASLAGVWGSAMEALGVSTSSTSLTVTGAFQAIFDFCQWMSDGVVFALNVAAFAITNWRDVFELAGAQVALSVVSTANQIIYFFSDVIPGVLSWFADNWKDIFTTIWTFTKSVFLNLGKNIGAFASALWSFLKGDGFNFEFTGLLDGFESTIKQLPQIADRELGPVEKSLKDQVDSLSGILGEGLAKSLDGQTAKSAGVTDAITSAVMNAAGGLSMPTIPAPTIATPIVPDADTSSLANVGKKAKEASQELKAVLAGSAEAQQARYLATFQSKNGPIKPGVSAAPVASSAQKAMRDSAAQSKTLDESLAEQKRTNKILLDIHEDSGEELEQAEL